MIRRPRFPRSPGFTLLEVIASVAVSLLLVYAVYSAAALHYKAVEAGRERGEQGQLTRAITMRLREDLRSAFARWKPGKTATSSTGASSAGTSNEAADAEDVTSALPPGGVSGTASVVGLVVKTPMLELDYTPNAMTSSPRSDLCFIRYRLATAADPAPDGGTGLVREVYTRIPAEVPDNDPTGLMHATVVAPEVTQLSFRYFDGADYWPTWDSTATQSPTAIEMTIGIVRPGAPAGAVAAEDIRTQRLLIWLPDNNAQAGE